MSPIFLTISTCILPTRMDFAQKQGRDPMEVKFDIFQNQKTPLPQGPDENPKTHRDENMGNPAGKITTKTHRVLAILHRGDPGWG